VGMQVKL